MSSVTVKPDFAAVVHDLLVLLIKVHSSSYPNTVAKSAANAIDQLRLLRVFSLDISKISSFVFPKFAKNFKIVELKEIKSVT